MAKIVITEEGVPASPASGTMALFADSSNSSWTQKNDSGIYQGDGAASIVAQIASHSADTYYKGIQLPSFGMQAGMTIMWEFFSTKGAAGVATPVYTIRIGPNQTTADTSRLAITGATQTGAIDSAFVKVMVNVRSVGVAGVIQGTMCLQHNLAATGFANTPAGFNMVEGTAAGFDNTSTIAGQYIGLSVNPGASGAWVTNQCFVRIWY